MALSTTLLRKSSSIMGCGTQFYCRHLSSVAAKQSLSITPTSISSLRQFSSKSNESPVNNIQQAILLVENLLSQLNSLNGEIGSPGKGIKESLVVNAKEEFTVVDVVKDTLLKGTVSNGKAGLGVGVAPAPRTYSSGKPPLPTSHRKRCREIEIEKKLISKSSASRGCHCCKRRKTVVKREIKRVTSGSAGDCIPADEYSWKKYDQKLVPGTVFPRGYYKCNTVKGCPARKRVERTSNDPTVLILTYEGEHRHHHHHRSQSSSHHHPTVAALTRLNNNSSDVGICY